LLLETIVADAKNKNPKAFRELYKRYRRYVTGVLFRQGVDSQDIEDMSQIFWMKCSASLPKLRDNSKFEPWIRQTIVNLSYDYKRKFAQQKNRQSVSINFILDEEFGTGTEEIQVPFTERHDERMDAEVVLARVEAQKKKDTFITAAVLYAEGETYEGIARNLNVKLGTVKSRIFRGRARLAESHAGVLEPS